MDITPFQPASSSSPSSSTTFSSFLLHAFCFAQPSSDPSSRDMETWFTQNRSSGSHLQQLVTFTQLTFFTIRSRRKLIRGSLHSTAPLTKVNRLQPDSLQLQLEGSSLFLQWKEPDRQRSSYLYLFNSNRYQTISSWNRHLSFVLPFTLVRSSPHPIPSCTQFSLANGFGLIISRC